MAMHGKLLRIIISWSHVRVSNEIDTTAVYGVYKAAIYKKVSSTNDIPFQRKCLVLWSDLQNVNQT